MPTKEPLRLGLLDMTLRNVDTPFGLRLDEVRIGAEDVGFDFESKQYTALSPARVVVTVLEEDLGIFLDKRAPGALKAIQTRIVPGFIHVAATARVIVEIRAKAICTLRIESGKRLLVDLVEVEGMAPAVKSIVQTQLDRINPVLDATDLPLDVTLDEARLLDGRLTLLAHIPASGPSAS